jgi:hypothetical protein
MREKAMQNQDCRRCEKSARDKSASGDLEEQQSADAPAPKIPDPKYP